jgi:hypothetical protein
VRKRRRHAWRTWQNSQRDAKKDREDHRLMASFTEALEGKGGYRTKEQLQSGLGWGLPRFNRILDLLVESGVVETCQGLRRRGPAHRGGRAGTNLGYIGSDHRYGAA